MEPHKEALSKLCRVCARTITGNGLYVNDVDSMSDVPYASGLVNRGFDPITISRLSGHRNPASVTSYCADTSEQKKEKDDGRVISISQWRKHQRRNLSALSCIF